MRREVRRGWWTTGIDELVVLRGIRPYSGMLASLVPVARSSGGGETMWSKLARVVVNRLRSPLSRIAVSLVGGCLVLRRLAAFHGSQHLQQGVFGLALADLELAYPRPYLPVRIPRRYPGMDSFLSWVRRGFILDRGGHWLLRTLGAKGSLIDRCAGADYDGVGRVVLV